jgi:halocyanin-like protein
MTRQRSRRRFVQAFGVVAGLGLAGCSGGGDTSTTDAPTSTATTTEAGTPTATDTPMATEAGNGGTETGTPTPTAASAGSDGATGIDDYLADTTNYDGTVADRTGQEEVTVRVGAEGNGGGFAFGPPAVRVDPGTTLVWEWTGSGGLHNVVAENGDFDSGSPVSGDAETFSHAVSGTGTWLYYCNPHRALGMKGAVVVP